MNGWRTLGPGRTKPVRAEILFKNELCKNDIPLYMGKSIIFGQKFGRTDNPVSIDSTVGIKNCPFVGVGPSAQTRFVGRDPYVHHPINQWFRCFKTLSKFY